LDNVPFGERVALDNVPFGERVALVDGELVLAGVLSSPLAYPAAMRYSYCFWRRGWPDTERNQIR